MLAVAGQAVPVVERVACQEPFLLNPSSYTLTVVVAGGGNKGGYSSGGTGEQGSNRAVLGALVAPDQTPEVVVDQRP